MKILQGILQKPREKNANFGEVFARFRARFLPAQKVQNLAQNLARNLARKSCDRTGLKDKFTDNFMQYFSCTNVYHEKEGIWKKGRNTKDKVDEGKIKCDGSLIVSYTPLSGHIVKRNNKHKCNKEL